MTTVHHIVSVSGGKDSTATYLLAVEWSQRTGRPFRAVFADTGNEHPTTYDYVRDLPRLTGGPEIEWVKADFSRQIARVRERLERYAAGEPEDRGYKYPWTPERAAGALEALHPTGIPFFDLCLFKGMFPVRRRQFCTEQLKALPIREHIVAPILEAGEELWSWQGVRRDEAKSHDHPRANLPRNEHIGGGYWVTRPIIEWTVGEVIQQHWKHGIEPNPLYKQGMNRVGCMPCINCSKGELREIAARFPSEIERIAEWERSVSQASRSGGATFFAITDDPMNDPSIDLGGISPERHGILSRVKWAKTTRGGRQYDLLADLDDDTGCSSAYGLCE